MKAWWGQLSLRTRLAAAFGFLAAGALTFLLAIIARALGPSNLTHGKIIPTAICVLAAFFIGGWFVAGWCLAQISRIGASINLKAPERLPTELEGLAALLRHEAQKRDALLQELRRFTADASHELRTPLTAIRSVGEIALRSDNGDSTALRDTIGSMLEEAQRMNALVDRLLRLARVESEGLRIEPRQIALADSLETLRESMAVLGEEKNVQLLVDCPRQLSVISDPELLDHALTNLLHNAIQHGPPGTVVSLVARKNFDGGHTIEITDQGPGIAAEHRDRIFERFYRIDPSRSRNDGGFGLGLCIAKTAIDRLGGNIEVSSELGRGSTFRVRLPATVS